MFKLSKWYDHVSHIRDSNTIGAQGRKLSMTEMQSLFGRNRTLCSSPSLGSIIFQSLLVGGNDSGKKFRKVDQERRDRRQRKRANQGGKIDGLLLQVLISVAVGQLHWRVSGLSRLDTVSIVLVVYFFPFCCGQILSVTESKQSPSL